MDVIQIRKSIGKHKTQGKHIRKLCCSHKGMEQTNVIIWLYNAFVLLPNCTKFRQMNGYTHLATRSIYSATDCAGGNSLQWKAGGSALAVAGGLAWGRACGREAGGGINVAKT